MTNESALYIVATPIGNLADITLRAIEILRTVSLIAAEDTRHSAKLLSHIDVQTPMLSYHDHSGSVQVERILARLEKGESVALISDAGTPLISDPGYRLVLAARQRGLKVIPIPGACALITALCASGLASDHFLFEGFLPAKSAARKSALEVLKRSTATLIFYESTHRISESLADMGDIFGSERKCCVARELTKTYETFLSGSFAEVGVQISEDAYQRKGEFVVMVDGFRPPVLVDEISPEAQRVLMILHADLPLKQAAALASKITGEKKNKLYQWATSQ